MRLSATYAAIAFLAAGLLMQPALAAKKESEVKQSIDTTATPEKVWTVIGDFNGIADWLPPAASSPATDGNNVGSVRTITLKAPGDLGRKVRSRARGGRRHCRKRRNRPVPRRPGEHQGAGREVARTAGLPRGNPASDFIKAGVLSTIS